MSYDVAHETCLCRFLQTGEHQRHGGLLGRDAFLDRISYPVALLFAAVLGFEGALVALSASEAVATKQGRPQHSGLKWRNRRSVQSTGYFFSERITVPHLSDSRKSIGF